MLLKENHPKWEKWLIRFLWVACAYVIIKTLIDLL